MAIQYQQSCPTCRMKMSISSIRPIYFEVSAALPQNDPKYEDIIEKLIKNKSWKASHFRTEVTVYPRLSSEILEKGSEELIENASEHPMILKRPTQDSCQINPCLLRSEAMYLKKFVAYILSACDKQSKRLAEKDLNLSALLKDRDSYRSKYIDMERKAAVMHTRIQDYEELEKQLCDVTGYHDIDGVHHSFRLESKRNNPEGSSKAQFSSEKERPSICKREASQSMSQHEPFQRAMHQVHDVINRLKEEVDRLKTENNHILLEKVNLQRKLQHYKHKCRSNKSISSSLVAAQAKGFNEGIERLAPENAHTETSRHGNAIAIKKEIHRFREHHRSYTEQKSAEQANKRKVYKWIHSIEDPQ